MGIGIVFMTFDGISHVLKLPQAVEASVKLGWSAEKLFWVGLVQLICLVLYVVPKTRILGLLLLVGYLGGAVATNLRADTPVFNWFFPVIIAGFLAVPLWLQDKRVKALF